MAPKTGTTHGREFRGRGLSKAQARQKTKAFIKKTYRPGHPVTAADIERFKKGDPRLNGNVEVAIKDLVRSGEVERTKGDGLKPG